LWALKGIGSVILHLNEPGEVFKKVKLPPFKLEEFLGEREFSTEVMFSGSDMESFALAEIIAMAKPETLKMWNTLRLHYTEPKGHPQLLQEIANLYGFESPSQNICTFAGAEEGIYAAMQVLLGKDDHVIVVTPCYQSLGEIPKSLCEVTEVELRFQHGTCWVDVHDIEKAVRSNTKILVLNFPHNPTGAMITKEDQDFLVTLARRHGFYIFCDEVYRGLEHDSKDQLPPFASVYEKGISLGVMSKPYGLPGIRVGWLAMQDSRILQEIGHFKHYLSICNSAPSEILAIIALQNHDKIIARNQNILQANLKMLIDFFKKHEAIFEWFEPKGGCIAYPRLLLNEDVYDFAEEFRKKEGVLILPGSVFDDTNNHFRISYGRSNMPEALRRFESFLK
jgi:aspartate/methionine/tyrosine aminotransferase